MDELRENFTIVIVTHSMQQAARVSQRTAFFHLGKLIEVGDTEQIFTNPREILLTEDYPSPINPLGIKGAGESGINGVGGAIACAIDDAIGIPGAITELPVTPQKLKAILASKKKR